MTHELTRIDEEQKLLAFITAQGRSSIEDAPPMEKAELGQGLVHRVSNSAIIAGTTALYRLPSYALMKRANVSSASGKRFAKAVFLTLLAATGSRFALAAGIRMAGPDRLGELNAVHATEVVDKSGRALILPSETGGPQSLALADMTSESLTMYGALLAYKEDKGAAKKVTPLRYLGLDFLGLARAVISIPSDTRVGGSTLEHQVCSRLYSSYQNTTDFAGIQNRLREIKCGMVIASQNRNNSTKLFAQVASHNPVAIGAPSSRYGAAVNGVVLGAPLLFGEKFEDLETCQLSMLIAAHQLPVMMPRKEMGIDAAERRWSQVVQIARRDLAAYSNAFSRNKSKDEDCFARQLQPWMRGHDVTNPSYRLVRSVGPLMASIRNETSILHGQTSLNLELDFMQTKAARENVEVELCRIGKRRGIVLNLCSTDDVPLEAMLRILVVDRSGLITHAVSLGPQAEQFLDDRPSGSAEMRGSIYKPLLIPWLQGRVLCRRSRNGLQDANGFHGVEAAQCAKGGAATASLRTALAKSHNLSILDGLSQISDAEFELLKIALGFPRDAARTDLVLGLQGLSLASLHSHYSAITDVIAGGEGRGSMPHFVGSTPASVVMLPSNAPSGEEYSRLLSASLETGTARQFNQTMNGSDFKPLTAKTGSSESGLGSNERGRFISGTLQYPDGGLGTYYVGLASPNSSPLAVTSILSSGDLGALLAATLNKEIPHDR